MNLVRLEGLSDKCPQYESPSLLPRNHPRDSVENLDEDPLKDLGDKMKRTCSLFALACLFAVWHPTTANAGAYYGGCSERATVVTTSTGYRGQGYVECLRGTKVGVTSVLRVAGGEVWSGYTSCVIPGTGGKCQAVRHSFAKKSSLQYCWEVRATWVMGGVWFDEKSVSCV